MNGGVTAGPRVAPAAQEFRNRLLDWMPEFSLLLVMTVAGLWAAGRWLDPSGDPGIWWSTVYRLANGERLCWDIYLQFGPLSLPTFSTFRKLSPGAREDGMSEERVLSEGNPQVISSNLKIGYPFPSRPS